MNALIQVSIHGPSIYGAYIGESEAQLRAVFDEARDYCSADQSQAVIIFIDELVRNIYLTKR
jgi:SpoVK/Ycf46/Vps4 family AAA+-type ATPase